MGEMVRSEMGSQLFEMREDKKGRTTMVEKGKFVQGKPPREYGAVRRR